MSKVQFTASAFATGIPKSHGNVGALAIVTLKDGTVLASGGANRGSLYRFDKTGGAAGTPLATLSQPIFDMAVDRNGTLWATTGGGSLLQLDSQTGRILKEFGESITQTLAIHPANGSIYVSSANGIEIFNPFTETFTHFSDLRVDSLAFAPDGKLWGTSWPDRGLVVRFDQKGRAQQMLSFFEPVDSLAFGATGSRLEGLAFVSTNNGDLLMVDLATLQHVKVGVGSRDATAWGENVETTSDGRMLISHSGQIDILNPILAPKVAATNPVKDAIVALPQNTISVIFDSDMFAGSASELASVLNPNNYQLIGVNSNIIQPVAVRYDAFTKSALLGFNNLEAGNYEFKVLENIQSSAGVKLGAEYKERFTTVSNFSSLVDFNFSNARSDRANETVSFDVTITSKADQDLLLPVMLLLDPASTFTGVPTGAVGRNQNGAYLLDLKDSLPDGRLKPGASTTVRTITVKNPDAMRVEFTPGIYAIPYPNVAPVITSNAIVNATVGQIYNYQVAANDPDGSVLGYLLYDAPTGMQVDNNGLITWTPGVGQSKSENVTLYVYDLRGGYTTQSFIVDVAGANNKPVFQPIAVNGGTFSPSPTLPLPPSSSQVPQIRGAEGRTLQIQVKATDLDKDKLTYWVDNIPGGAVFDPTTGILTWTPGFDQAGTYENIQFTVTDGKERVTQTANILIAPTNQAPTFTRPSDKTVREGDYVRIQLKASDADGSTLNYFSNLLPGGATLDPKTGLFEWTPSYFQAGVFEIPFLVSDGESITTQTTKITVLNVNAAPVFQGLTRWEAQEGENVRFRAFAFDPDNPGFVAQDRNAKGELTILEGSDPTVTYTVSGLPNGATFDATTGMFSWTPGYTSSGTYNVTFTATDDGNGLGANQVKTTNITIPVTIRNVNRAPNFDSVAISDGVNNPTNIAITTFNPDGTAVTDINAFANLDVNRGEIKEITFKVTDLESDALRLSLDLERNAGEGIPNYITFRDNGDGTATLRIAPGADAFGNNYSFRLTATEVRTDGVTSLSNKFDFNINIIASNSAPKINYVGNKVAVVGETLEFIINTSDRDQDPLNFSFSGLPQNSNATITPTGIYGQAKFTWTPTAADVNKTYPLILKVRDSGNNNQANALEGTQTINLVVRNSNSAPVFGTIANPTISENSTLTLQIPVTDADGDTITYSARNLPTGAVLDAKTGLLTWKPAYNQSGKYEDIELIASDGNKTSYKPLIITVNNSNVTPVFTPLLPQFGQENSTVDFTLVADDADQEGLVYSSVLPLPQGAILDSRTGKFTWKPNFDQAGDYTFKFAVTDPSRATVTQDVVVRIANVNRTPVLSLSNRAVALGETLSFKLNGSDPDRNSSLIYSADNLPEGAKLEPNGQFTWNPSPGQAGNYSITFNISDGELTTSQTALFRVVLTPVPPTVLLDSTPSFPAVPGQKVVIQTQASGLAEITSLTATVAGRPVIIDALGRFEFTANTPGRVIVEAIATDADGRVGRTSQVIKVRDEADTVAPVVSFAAGFDVSGIINASNITGTIADTNLDEWVLSIADFGSNQFTEIARGNQALSGSLASFDPGKYNNGFYQLRLNATDISGRSSSTQAVIEVNSNTKPSAYVRSETDLTTTIGGVAVNLVRTYNSLNNDEFGSFGNGWRLANTDADIQTNVPLTGRSELGVYNPLRVGTRLYLTAPSGERIGFTFAPVKKEIPGVTYYTPAWVADEGVNYTLESVDAKLTLVGNSFYDMKTGFAYNPASGKFEGHDYKLIANCELRIANCFDGTVYYLDSKNGVVEQVATNGTRLVYSDSGITSSTGETIRFVKDTQGRLQQITAPDGSFVSYTYSGGNLVAARNVSTGNASRYGYTDSLLTLASGNPGSVGSAISYGATPTVLTVGGDLGGAVQFNGKLTNGTGDSRYTFSLRDTEISSTATGIVLVSAEVLGNGVLRLPGLSPLVSKNGYGLYAVEKAGLNLLSVSETGAFDLRLSVAGDVNRDGNVDGVDSELLSGAIAIGNYSSTYDFNRDGKLDAADVQILGSNYGFTANKAPVVKATTVLTHTDLEAFVELDTLATDPEGDRIFFRAVNPINGTVIYNPDGTVARFIPLAGYYGEASFDLIADDGFSSSAPSKVTINVSNAPLQSIDFITRGMRLNTGDTADLIIVGNFADQANVLLPYSYLQLATENANPASPMIASIFKGEVTGLNDGIAYLKASRDGISAVTALRVGQTPTPIDEADFNVVIAEEEGLQLYPQSVTMTPGMTRRLLVGVDESFTPNLSAATNGTRYFVSNPNILEVDANGKITARNSGIADVTVIYGAAEFVVPVRVTNPLGAREIGIEGGVVQGSDGSQVLVGPNTFNKNTPISIQEIQAPAQTFSLPIPESEDLQFVKAFRLELGDTPLDSPVQLAIPAPANLVEGTEVIFLREATAPTESGNWEPIWELEEIGVVGADGMIRTQSPPLPGILRTGNRVAIASPKYKFVDVRFELPPETLNALAGLVLTTSVYTSVTVAALNTLKISLPSGAGSLAKTQTDAFVSLKEQVQQKLQNTLQSVQKFAKLKTGGTNVGQQVLETEQRLKQLQQLNQQAAQLKNLKQLKLAQQQPVRVMTALSSSFAGQANASTGEDSIQGTEILSGLAGFGAAAVTTGGVLASGAGGASRASVAGNLGINLGAVGAVHALMNRNVKIMTLEIFQVPPVGLPEVTKAGAEINSSGIYEIKNVIQQPRLSFDAEAMTPPIIESAELKFVEEGETKEPVIFLTGSNFLNGTNDVGGSLQDLIVDFTFGGKTYSKSIWAERSRVLAYNRYEIAVKPPETVPLSEVSIRIRRPQKLFVGSEPSKFETIQLKSERQISLTQPEVEYALVARRWSDRIDVIDLANPRLLVNNTPEGSANFLAASIPVGTRNPGQITGTHRPRDVAATKDAGRAYAILDRGAVALLDLMALRQVDTDLDTAGVDSIELPPGAAPESIVIEPNNNYAYIADGVKGIIYVLDINPRSANYHKLQTISVDAPNGMRKLAISGDGKKLYGTAPTSTKGKIITVNIDPKDKPSNPAINTRKWHEQIGVTLTAAGSVEGIEATSDPKRMVFTHRYSEPNGFGVLTVENDNPLSFQANANRNTDLKLKSGEFEVNEARNIVITRDKRFAFVLGYNGYQINRGFNLIGENPYSPATFGKYYGTSIGIIQDPLGTPELIASTRPIPMGLGVDLSLTSDDRYLIGTYPGVDGYFVFDVEEIERTIDVLSTDGQNEFQVDPKRKSGRIYQDLKFSNDLIGLREPRRADIGDLLNIPIDDINPSIDIAGRFEVTKLEVEPKSVYKPKEFVVKDIEYGTPDDPIAKKNAPIGRGGNPRSVSSAANINWVKNFKVDNNGELNAIVSDLTPTFDWNFDASIDLNKISEVKLYISTFDKGEGLVKKDWTPSEATTPIWNNTVIPGRDDYNPNRILSVTWLKDKGGWHWNDEYGNPASKITTENNSYSQFTLPNQLKLTAGQQYYWAIEAYANNANPDLAHGAFRTQLPTPLMSPSDSFANVTVLTHDAGGLDQNIYDTAYSIAGEILDTEQQGVVLQYHTPTGQWFPVRKDARALNTDLNPQNLLFSGDLLPRDRANYQTRLRDYLRSHLGKPLVMVVDWSDSEVRNSGFAEGAADALFASFVQLDQNFLQPGQQAIGAYDSSGKLIRTQGLMFNSPMHFIGFGRGAVVNSEIVQRLGIFYPNAGGTSQENRDLHVTTVNPYQYQRDGQIADPTVTTWKNVTYADNYYYTGKDSQRYKELTTADWNVRLNSVARLPGTTNLEQLSKTANAWYEGTTDLSGSKNVFRRLGDLDAAGLGDTSKWYSPDHTDANFENSLVPWEGIGTGWFHSVLGGGYEQRPYLIGSDKKGRNVLGNFDNYLRNRRQLVSSDNTIPTAMDENTGARMRGDYAVPTLFNGNFDAITWEQARPEPLARITGWSFGQNNSARQNNLRRAGNNIFLELQGGTRGSGAGDTITHNPFIVPEWGDLRFDLSVADGLNAGRRLFVSLNPINPNDGSAVTQNILIEDALGTLGQYTNDRYRIGYGSQAGRFETFNIDVPQYLRGKAATLTFSLEAPSGTTIRLDNVFFKSDVFQLGNPTEARPDSSSGNYNNNYLIEKPQYSLSYNRTKNTPNWVSWQVNRSWLSDDNLRREDFTEDPELPSGTGWYKVQDDDYGLNNTRVGTGSTDFLARGHITAAADRTRSRKDYTSTYLTTNLLPIHQGNNSGPWQGLERYLRSQVQRANIDFSVIAGGYGTNTDLNSINVTDNAGNITQRIHVPSHVWKVVVWRNFGEPIENARGAFAVVMPNQDIARTDWGSSAYLRSIQWLEDRLREESTQPGSTSPTYNFLGGIQNEATRDRLKTVANLPPTLPPLPRASLLADDWGSFADTTALTISASDISVRHNSILEGNSQKLHSLQIGSHQISSMQAGSLENSITKVGSSQISIIEQNIVQSGSAQVSSAQVSPIEVRHPQIGSTEISPTEIGIFETRLPEGSPTKISINQDNSIQVSFRHTNIAQVSPAQVSITQVSPQVRATQINSPQVIATQTIVKNGQADASKISLASSIPLQQFLNVNVSSSHTYLKFVRNTKDNSLNLWSTLFDPTNPFDLTFQIQDLPTGQLAEAQLTKYDQYGRPNGGTILIDHDANGLGWFIDQTPWENSEFSQTLAETAFRATNSPAAGKYDLLTTILHEMGHLVGIIDGNPGFDRHVQTINGTRTFVGDGFTATLTRDGSHLDSRVHQYDLMNNTLAPGVRKLPSLLNLQMLNAIRNNTVVNNSIAGLTAPLTSTPLVAILNGDFETQSDWSTRGAARIINSEAVLTEDSPLNSNFSQSFIIPEGAKYLQFTLKNTTLGANSTIAPGDAFEVALLNTNTKQSLLTGNGLTQTDSLLNIQHDGKAYTSSRVRLVNQTTPDSRLTLNQPLTFKVDLTGIQAGTAATLYFDLLGFGARDARVVLDDIMLLNNDPTPPQVNNDSATTDQTKPVTINVLANDTDSTIIPASLQVKSNPTNGTVLVKPDGTITYTPNSTFVGTDTFTYTVINAEGLTSNTATVNITVNNIAPVITVITGDNNTAEGTLATFTADATDPGDNLTYSWNFGDGSEIVTGQTVNHTYADNGTYTATLTVTDSKGVSSFQTLVVTVNNAAPIVNAGADLTINEGQEVSFNGAYSDPGILDTHTVAWDFGDGTTVTGVLNPTHIYTSDGNYTATLTITDKDGSSTTDTLTVQVNNTAPTITNVIADTNIAEGTPAKFGATATDSGNKTLTYIWNFGDGSEFKQGKDVSHVFKDNGTYNVTLTVKDTSGASTEQTLTVNVNNLAPIVNAGNDATSNEGQSLTFNGGFTDFGILDTHTITWDFGDGTTTTGVLNPTHTYADNGTYNVTMTVTDKDGAITQDTLTVTVNNLGPSITNLTGDTNINEGATANFSATATDSGNDTLTYIWNFGDGSDLKQGKDVSHIFKDNGNYTVTLTVKDEDGGSTSQTLAVNVNNVAATVDAGVNQISYTQESVSFNGGFTDPGILDTHTIVWDFGDGNTASGVLNPSHIYTQDGVYTATLTITDDDGAVSTDTMTVTVKKPPTLSVSDISIQEGDDGKKIAVFTATLSEASLRNISANFSTSNGTATDGTDYLATSGTINFAAGETTKTIAVEILGDTLDEFDESFFLNLSNPSNVIIGKTIAVATIQDDDAPPTLTINDRTITEGDNSTQLVNFTISLSAPSGKPITVNYTTANGTAIAGSDYNATNGTLTFAPGETSKDVSVQVIGDTLDEFDETFTLNLADATNATITDNQGNSTIEDNDLPPEFTITDRSITESDNGTQLVNFTISLNAPSGKPITVNYATADGTAIAGTDYTATNGTLTFAPGETSKNVSVQVIGDTLDEFDETFSLNLADATNATIVDNQGLATIVDNDEAPTFDITDRSITESDNGTQLVNFTISLRAASGKPITVNYTTADGTAIAGTDYTATNGTLTFAPGETSKTVSVQVIGDTMDEFDETFSLNLADATNATIVKNQANSTILDNDEAPLFAISDKSITEGDNGTQLVNFTISLSAPSGKPITVNYTTADGTAIAGTDYTATNGTLTFAPGETSKTVSVQVIGDTLDEFDETFTLNLADATNATITDNQGLATIEDNDLPPEFTITDRSITEGDNGTQLVNFIISLSAPSGKPVSVKYATSDGTAIAGTDYTATNGTLTFAPGETSKTVSVQVLGDTLDEFDETFGLNLADATNATIVDNQGLATIVDNDLPPELIINDRTITEGDNGTMTITYTVSLNALSGKPIAVDYTTADGTATAGKDYTATNGRLTFAPGETTKTITVQVLGDSIDEFDETFSLNLINPTNATITKSQGVTTILDNDLPPVLTINDRTITEGHNGTQMMNFTVSLSGASEKPISVKYATANGTALAGSDYNATNGILTFAAGETSKTVSVAIIGERLDEQNENFFVNLSEGINATIGDAQGVGTIIDDDESPVLTVAAVPGELWPPNHKMVEVKVNTTVRDDHDPNPVVRLLSITSNEPDNGLGDGDTAGDIEIRPDGRIFLRAERSGNGNGRVYTLTYSATDNAGNTTISTTQVRVPKSKGN